MKKILLICFCIVMVLSSITACAPKDADSSKESGGTSVVATDPEKQLHFVYVTPLIAHPVWLIAKRGFEEACEDFGIRGDWIGPADVNTDEMIKDIDIAITEKADGIITQGMNPEAMLPVLRRADEAGIPYVITDSDIPDSNRLAYLGLDPEYVGKAGAEAILAVTKGAPIKAAVVVAALDYKIVQDQMAAYEKYLTEGSESFEWVATQADDGDQLKAVQAWENIFTTYPECNVAINLDGVSGIAAAQVAREKGMGDDVIITAIDDLEETLDLIREGDILATVAGSWYRHGYEPVLWLLNYINDGAKPAKMINDAGTIAITQENVDTYGTTFEDPTGWGQ